MTDAASDGAGGGRVIPVPALGLVVLVGPAGAGKSTLAARHFAQTEVLSSDRFRGLVADDEADQSATPAAFEALFHVARLRLALGRIAVIDATNVRPRDRAHLLRIARDADVGAIALVLDLDAEWCIAHDAARPDRQVGAGVIRAQIDALRAGLPGIDSEGFRAVHVLSTPEEVADVQVERVPTRPDKRTERGPFDILGDIHGCIEELAELLDRLGYVRDDVAAYRHPQGRRAIFLGDLVDRGPGVIEVVDIARRMVAGGTAFGVPGNHDDKLVRYLRGRHVQVRHGLEQTVAQLDALPSARRDAWIDDTCAFFDELAAHLVLDGGRLVVAHAGMKAEYQLRSSGRVRSFALFGETTGEHDEYGLPVRLNWAAEYHGTAAVVYGHTPIATPVWQNDTINIDTGCVFGGRLTALRWPERELVSVRARRMYAVSRRPFLPADDLLGE